MYIHVHSMHIEHLSLFFPQSKMTIHCLSNVTGLVKLVGIQWYNGSAGFLEPNCPCLVITYDNGRAELRRHELDDSEWVV